MKVLIKERDGARSTVARLESDLAAEQEAKCAMEARVEAIRLKAVEIEEAHRTTEGAVMELRASLGRLKTMRDASHSELHGTQ